MSILPAGMDGRPYNGTYAKDGALQDWQRNATETLARSLERPKSPHTQQRIRSGMQHSIRTVTPEPREDGGDELYGRTGAIHTSPRSIPGGEKPRDRRQGLVFQGSYSTDSLDGPGGGGGGINAPRSGPPVSFNSHSRPRTRTMGTMEESHRPRSTSNTVSRSRHRIGSVHSTASSSFHDVQPQATADVSNSLGFPSISTRPPQQLQKSNSVKGGRRLMERSSRPTSPMSSGAMGDVPSVDSLPFPVATGDANKILMLMKKLCGRMRGEVEYQTIEKGPWYSGICYIDDVKGSLMYEGEDRGPFHLTVIADLRGCRVKPISSPERPVKCLELSNRALGIEIHLLPMVNTEYDLWLAALLSWQQIRTTTLPASPPRSTPAVATERRPGPQRRESSFTGNSRVANIIKVAKLLLWDKGPPTSPRAIVKRPSTRDLRSSSRSCWRRVSCILQDNGEFKLLTENDITLLSVIQLSQLSRCAIQRLDRSVLDEEYCIAIFPQYTSTSTQLSIFRPVYIALESRLTHEVWFCLLRAFTIPEIYGPQLSTPDVEYDDLDSPRQQPPTEDMFRIEKSINLRIVEAKIRRPHVPADSSLTGKPTKAEPDPSIGDYFAEVVMDGEIRAKTITRTETRNPFWREDCEFLDLPAHLPTISIILKQMEAPPVSSHGFLSSSSVHIPTHPIEVLCGKVEIPIDKLERGKENETWWPILDEQQEPIGEIFLRIRHDELVVLLAKNYQPISELLHNFGSGLTVQIAQVIPTSLRKLSEILMNIFQVSGHAGEWLTALVEEEIDGLGKEPPTRRLRWSRRIGSNESYASASDREQTVRDMGKSLQGEANLLFRGNSLLTQALDFHMRRLGKEYLEEVLSEKIAEINAMNPECEVDPSRIYQGDDIGKNWALLTSLTTNVWEGIASSANRCPPELRQILKYIRAVAEDRYGDFLRTVTYTSVSGFLFLRFFCPALLNPKLFGLLKDHPQAKAQRTFTLIAKSLQALANLSNFGQKEAWMEPMNRFLNSHRQSLKDFIDTICDIPAERNTFALPASYSTPITILARLPPTSREGFPSLPYLIDHARNFAALVKLWLDATSHYMSPQNLDGDLLEFNDLCIALQRRTDDCLLKAEAGERNADQLSLQWEEIVETLENSHLNSSPTDLDSSTLEPEIHSPPWAEYSATVTAGTGSMRRPPGSAGSGSETGKERERKERQSFWESTFGKESRYQRPYGSVTAGDNLDESQASPPSRGQSRNGKPSRSFLSGLRRKGNKAGGGGGGGGESTSPTVGNLETGGQGSWNGPGGMI
ncbi:RasGAP protein-like protein [Acephala macrosclerotiorum]|nr:RasGAP protein-like protein [Acephala macrosclerotiorum]